MMKPVSPFLVVEIENSNAASGNLFQGKIAVVSGRDESEFPVGTRVLYEKGGFPVNDYLNDPNKTFFLIKKTTIVCRL